jgi:hypothetical protein
MVFLRLMEELGKEGGDVVWLGSAGCNTWHWKKGRGMLDNVLERAWISRFCDTRGGRRETERRKGKH